MTAEPVPHLYDPTYTQRYSSGMAKRVMMGVQEFRLSLRDRVSAGRDKGEHTVLSWRGRPVGVYVPIDWYREKATELGDRLDIEVNFPRVDGDAADHEDL